MHVTAHRRCTNWHCIGFCTKSWLWEKSTLSQWGIEPDYSACSFGPALYILSCPGNGLRWLLWLTIHCWVISLETSMSKAVNPKVVSAVCWCRDVEHFTGESRLFIPLLWVFSFFVFVASSSNLWKGRNVWCGCHFSVDSSNWIKEWQPDWLKTSEE